MRRWMKVLVLAGLFAVLLCGSALAAETVEGSGFYNVGTNTGVKVAAAAANGTVEKVSANVNGGTDYETFYKGSDKLEVSVSGTQAGKQYLVMLVAGNSVPTADSQIYYIDQLEAAENTVPFTVLPKLPATTGALTLFVTSDDSDFGMKSVALGYAVNGTYDTAPYRLGYVDNDDRITATDAQWTLQIAVQKREATATQLLAANVDGDAKVTATDAQWILQAAVQKRVLN